MTRKQKNRWWNKFTRMMRAHLTHRFWLDCPICGEMFGGYESGEGVMTSWGGGEMTCKWCDEDAVKQNKEFMEKNPCPPVEE